MLGYRAQMTTPEQLAAEDPFRGSGLFLPLRASAEDILAALERALGGTYPAVAWAMSGVWVDTSALDLTADEIRARWVRG